MRTILLALVLVGAACVTFAAPAEAAPTGLVVSVPVAADVPYVGYRPGWRGCDPCRTCPPKCGAPYPYYRPYYAPKPHACRHPRYFRSRGCPPAPRTAPTARR